MAKKEETKERGKFRASLSQNGDSWLHDTDFSWWWKDHGAKFPGIPEDQARLIWTAAYDEGARVDA